MHPVRWAREYFLDFCLLVGIALGVGFVLHGMSEYAREARIHADLVSRVGQLPIGDPSRVHMQALSTGEPLHFLWRVRLPENYSQRFVLTQPGGNATDSWSTSSQPLEFICRLRLRESREGELQVFATGPSGSSRSSLSDKRLTELLRGRWQEVRVTQLGQDGVREFDAADPTLLLDLRLSDDMLETIEREWGVDDRRRYEAGLLRLTLGE